MSASLGSVSMFFCLSNPVMRNFVTSKRLRWGACPTCGHAGEQIVIQLEVPPQ